ncbi:MAG: DUF1320 family protein [Bacteroidales bacterium]|nr:DUF1320 family protein [Bacteroidales bacterium]
MFLQTEDYSVVTSPDDLTVITQSSEEIRQKAERIAVEEIAGYVRSRYDIDAAFAAEGEDRNPLLVQLTVSIALYYLGMWLPQFMGNDTRQTLYDNAISRLKDIQKGAFTPDFPKYQEGDGGSGSGSGDVMKFGSMPRQGYDY